MKLPEIIQGGMGVAISDWNLAGVVSRQGQLGVVSGTGISLIMISRLSKGDVGGHVRRALGHFPFQEPVKRLLDRYFVSEPRFPQPPFKRPAMWTVKPPKALTELAVLSNFVEVFLAKEGHRNAVGINLLEKIQLPILASLYGAMLAKVDYILMGAGIPFQIPAALDRLIRHEGTEYRLDVRGSEPGDDFRLEFDPRALFPGIAKRVGPLARPYFLPIISSVVLAKSLLKRTAGKIDGFVIETHAAGGHNAPPRGPMQLNESGEPIYCEKDAVSLEKIQELGLPYWLAGGHDSEDALRRAKEAGAAGVQVGTAFAYCDESGMEETLKERVLGRVLDRDVSIRTDPKVSPTGFPFKVVRLEGSMSESEVVRDRIRLCDVGGLRQLYKRPDGKIGFRCPGEPETQYLAKGGTLEETLGKACLCNNLAAAAGHPQHRKDGYVEAPLITAGDGLSGIGRFVRPGKRSYSVKDVLDDLIGDRMPRDS